MLQETKDIGRSTLPAYAKPSDFCRLFSEEMNSLYLLALMLTAEQKLAEECFASALKDCLKANGVFKNWAATWARRAIVQNAIRVMHVTRKDMDEEAQPALDGKGAAPKVSSVPAGVSDAPLAAVTGLAAFERFVFVMSVLESYSDQECRVLLGCFRHEVVQARTQALQHIGKSAEANAAQATTARGDLALTVRPNTLEFIPLEKFGSTVEFRGHRSTQG